MFVHSSPDNGSGNFHRHKYLMCLLTFSVETICNIFAMLTFKSQYNGIDMGIKWSIFCKCRTFYLVLEDLCLVSHLTRSVGVKAVMYTSFALVHLDSRSSIMFELYNTETFFFLLSFFHFRMSLMSVPQVLMSVVWPSG